MAHCSSILEAYQGRRVLITGAAGFLGGWVTRLLHASGAQLWIAGRRAAPLEALREAYPFPGGILVADLSAPGAFAPLYRAAEPHITFNVAGYGVDPAERDAGPTERINHRLVEEIVATLEAEPASDWRGLRLVHVGSAAEYGAVAGAVTEETPANPVNPYGRAKLAGTLALSRAIRRTGLRGTTARLFTIYGPGEHVHRLLPSLLASADSGSTLDLTAGEQQRDFTYVAEAAEALVRLGDTTAPVPPVINIATGTLVSVRRFAETAGEVLGMRPGQLHFGALPTRLDETPHGKVSTALLEATLGWKPVTPVREGIRQTAAFAPRLDPAKTGARN